jgi:hypothetical protein
MNILLQKNNKPFATETRKSTETSQSSSVLPIRRAILKANEVIPLHQNNSLNATSQQQSMYSLSHHYKSGCLEPFERKVVNKTLPVRSVAHEAEFAFLKIEAAKLKEKNVFLHCSFCKNNKETVDIFSSHNRTDRVNNIMCPVLRDLACQTCGGLGHTLTYCPVYIKHKKVKIIVKGMVNYLC